MRLGSIIISSLASIVGFIFNKWFQFIGLGLVDVNSVIAEVCEEEVSPLQLDGGDDGTL